MQDDLLISRLRILAIVTHTIGTSLQFSLQTGVPGDAVSCGAINDHNEPFHAKLLRVWSLHSCACTSLCVSCFCQERPFKRPTTPGNDNSIVLPSLCTGGVRPSIRGSVRTMVEEVEFHFEVPLEDAQPVQACERCWWLTQSTSFATFLEPSSHILHL